MNRGLATGTVLSILLLVGCASTKKNTLLLMAGTGAVGATVGAAAAPKGESQAMHALMVGASSAAVAGVAGLFIFDEEERHRETKESLAKAERDLIAFRKQVEPEVHLSGKGVHGGKLPRKYRHLVRGGSWRVLKVDRWVPDGDDRRIHYDEILELVKPEFVQ